MFWNKYYWKFIISRTKSTARNNEITVNYSIDFSESIDLVNDNFNLISWLMIWETIKYWYVDEVLKKGDNMREVKTNTIYRHFKGNLYKVLDIDVKDMNIDVLCFTGHKGLLGPQGTGGMYVKDGLKIKPLLSGGSGFLTFSKTHPDVMPTALEAGTLNTHGIAGLNGALKYLESYGIENIRNEERRSIFRICIY